MNVFDYLDPTIAVFNIAWYVWATLAIFKLQKRDHNK